MTNLLMYSRKMARQLRGGVILCLFVALFALMPNGNSVDITYTGDSADLETAPSSPSVNNSFFPGTNTSPIASNNTVTVDYASGADPARVFGGFGLTESSTNNKMYFLNGNADRIYGGYAENAGNNAERNTATISGGTLSSYAVGGFSAAGDALKNTLVIEKSGSVGALAIGGCSNGTGKVDDNTVKMTGGTVNTTIYGGYSANGSAEGNRILMSGGTVAKDVTGAVIVSGSGSAIDNHVVISGDAAISEWVYGGWSYGSGLATKNSVTVHNGTVNTNGGGTYGGYARAGGDAVGNKVTVYGGEVLNATGGYSHIADATDNVVSIYGGTIQRTVTGGESHGTNTSISGNIVEVFGGTIRGYVYGGYGSSTDSASGVNVSGNTVRIANASIGGIIYGGHSTASNNTCSGSANDNVVSISNSSVGNNIIGGLAWGNGTANNNSISIDAGVVLNPSMVGLYGGLTYSSGDVTTGNILNVNGYAGTVKEVNNFEYYNFRIASGAGAGGTILAIFDANATDLLGAKITVAGVESGSSLAAGESVTLIDKTSGAPGAFNGESARQGTILLYDFGYDSSITNAAVVTVKAVRVDPASKSHAEGRAASLAFIRQGHDFIVDSGFTAANAYLGRTGDGWSKPSVFGAVGGGHFRHKTGSHVDVDGVSMLAGLAWRNNGPCGSLLLGAFFEAGYADYDTHNAFASGSVRGDGDSRYYGGGFLARYDWQSGFYAEASGRVGGVKNKFHSDLTDALGNRARYDVNSPYFGAHAGVGYKWSLNEKASLDLSAKYLWSRQNSDSAVITGDRVHFDADDSHRVRTGARFVYAINDCIAPYVGAAFEYEFDGKARAGAYGHNFGVPSLKGGTGVGEIGLTVRRDRFTADLGVQGHVGRRDGVTGSLRVGWNF